MNIQDCVVEKGFVFELEFAAKGWNCSVKHNGEFIDNIYGFKLEARANPPVETEIDPVAEGLVLTLEGYKTDIDGEILEPKNGAVPSFSRSFLVSPVYSAGTGLVLIVEKEIDQGPTFFGNRP